MAADRHTMRLTRAALGVAAALALAACDSSPEQDAPPPAATGAAQGAEGGADGATGAADDGAVAADLLRLHREALATSEIGADRAANGRVRAFAEKVQEDYRAGERELAALVEGLDGDAPDGEPETPTLPGARGAEFDRAFLVAMSDHLNSSVQAAESAGDAASAELKEFATKHAAAGADLLAEVQDLQG